MALRQSHVDELTAPHATLGGEENFDLTTFKGARMSDAWLRGIVVLAIVLLVIHQVGAWAYSLLGPAGGIVSAVLVAAVSFSAARIAGYRRSNAWFIAPTLLFTLVPLGANFWAFMTADKSWWNRTIDFVPFLVAFAAPVLLLLVVYVELKNRASSS